MRVISIVGTCAILFLLSACADTNQLIRTSESNLSLASSDSVFIAVPKDGVYGQKDYEGSGETVAQMLVSAFARRLHGIESASGQYSLAKSLEIAGQNNYSFLVYPQILHWEDRATEWSGIPDRVEVKISIFETETGDVADSVIIKGKSGLATFGGDHPQDLLQKPVEEYVSSLF